MLKKVFDKPANPWRDTNQPTFLDIGDVLVAIAFSLAITGGSYAIVKYNSNAVDTTVAPK